MNYPLAFLSVVLAAITASCMTSPDVGQSSPTPVTHPADAPAAITTPESDTSSASSDSAEAAGLSISTSEEISVRSGPGVTFGIVGRLKPGRSYAVTGRGYEWLEVLLDHGTGWVFSPLVTLEGDLDAIPFMTPSPPPGALETTTFQYQEAAIACIGNLLGQSDLRLNFLEHTLMINSPNADVRVAVFEDPLGTRFSVDPATCTLVQIEPRGPRYSPGSPVSLDVLRQMALDLASRSPGFLELKPTLTYEEGEKDGLHFFTWSDMHREWKFNRPQLQVGLWED